MNIFLVLNRKMLFIFSYKSNNLLIDKIISKSIFEIDIEVYVLINHFLATLSI